MNEQSKTAPEAHARFIGTVEIKKIGNSSGIILPKDVLARMNVKRWRYALRDAHAGRRISSDAL